MSAVARVPLLWELPFLYFDLHQDVVDHGSIKATAKYECM